MKLSISLPDQFWHRAQALSNIDSVSKLIQVALQCFIEQNEASAFAILQADVLARGEPMR